MKDKAIAKITEEAMAIGDPMAIAIEEHLTARCTNTQIAEKLLAEDKSLKKAIDVIMQKARKIASENRKGNTGRAVISDADAYKMVITLNVLLAFPLLWACLTCGEREDRR